MDIAQREFASSDLAPLSLGVASPIQSYLDRLHARYAGLEEGEVASYIPELAKAKPEWFGICLAMTDGRVYEVGDTSQRFTIQSISKPFTYGLALEDRGRDTVLTKIGVEPTGDAFNSISLAPGTGCPLNPMINAGAIAATSLIAGHSAEDKLHRLLATFSMFAGRELSLDDPVYESERDTGHRNRAIGHMLRNFDIITEDPEPALNLYFQQCSISVDCRDLSIMAATLANGGINPITGERAVRRELVESILGVMTTCGMYDYAGEWVYWVGMPAKSGVAGGVIAVLPGQLGIGVFSPPLDKRGNSVRGVKVCRDMSRDFNLHFLRVARSSRSAIRAQFDISEVSSKRLRADRERRILDAVGHRARVYDLQGDLSFSAIETVVRKLVDQSEELDFAIIDLKRVTQIEQTAAELLTDLVLSFSDCRKSVLFVNVQNHSRFLRFLEEKLITPEQQNRLLVFPDIDPALEWCEDRLIAQRTSESDSGQPLLLAEHGLCKGLEEGEIAVLEKVMERLSFGPGELIIRKGEEPDRIYLLLKGQVSVTVALPNGHLKRLATLSPGMAFGELAVVERSVRTADVRADKPVDCYALSIVEFDRLGETDPRIKMTFLENLLRNVSQMVTKLNQEVTTLAQ